jgi:hypothetical protein
MSILAGASVVELQHKDPHCICTGMETVKFNTKPITISISEEGDWKIAERNVTQGRPEERILGINSH